VSCKNVRYLSLSLGSDGLCKPVTISINDAFYLDDS
jgi:hypothetical protein